MTETERARANLASSAALLTAARDRPPRDEWEWPVPLATPELAAPVHKSRRPAVRHAAANERPGITERTLAALLSGILPPLREAMDARDNRNRRETRDELDRIRREAMAEIRVFAAETRAELAEQRALASRPRLP